MKNFMINGIGKFLIQRQVKELVKFAWGGFPALVALILGIRFGMDNQLYMYISGGIIYILLFIYIPFNLKCKIKKVVLNLEFLEGKIKIETKKGISYLKKVEIIKAKGRFAGFGKAHTNGYILMDSNNKKEYWLIETFFNEMEVIEIELKKYM